MAGVSITQVARRYAVNANLIFKWLKDPRFAPQVVEAETIPAFLPVQISDAADEPLSPAPQSPPPAAPRAGGAQDGADDREGGEAGLARPFKMLQRQFP